MVVNEQRKKLIEDTRKSLLRIQEFDAPSISRKEELGRDLNFEAAVPAVQRNISLFAQVSPDVLSEFPDGRLTAIKNHADAEFNRLEQILKFTATDQNPKGTRDNLVSQVQAGYDTLFENLWPMIAYSVRRATDFARLEREARAAVQATRDEGEALKASLEEYKGEAEAALDAIRKVAAEQGVSQQAIYFKEESDQHATEAAKWLSRTAWLTVALIVFAFASLFTHKLPWLTPKNAFEASQLIVAKVFAFGALASFLFLASRNYLAHRHNAIVNKHRQNSLVTYTALVEAAGDHANRDIVLARAAETIFGPQSTGFAKGEGGAEPSLHSVLNVSPSLMKGSAGGGG